MTTATPSRTPEPGTRGQAGQDDGRNGVAGAPSRIGPAYLAYLIAPLALVVVLVMMHFGDIVRESAWLWVAVFIAVPTSSLLADRLYSVHPSQATVHIRIAVQAATVAVVIYLTGWGPVLVGSFAFLALENISRCGSQVWRITALWSLASIGIGQLFIAQGWAPSRLTLAEADSLALMGAFILVFVIWMAGVTMRKKEDAERRMGLSEDRFRSLIQDSSDITLVMDATGIITFVTPAAEVLLGFLPDELVGRMATDTVHPDDRDRVRARLGSDFQAAQEPALLQFRMERKDGSWCDVEAVVANLTARPSVAGYVAHVRDITERKEFEALLAHRALHDPLTGLANRQLILDRADQMINRARRTRQPIAAYFIDLDNFKEANDSLGHEAGDHLLQAVGRRLESILRPSDTVGRLGGDEFVILVEGLSLQDGPGIVADRIREVLRAPVSIEGFPGLPVSVTASIGIAVGDRLSGEELLRDADIALYRSKAAGRDQAVLFEPGMREAVAGRMELRSDLDTALAGDQFFLLYQPIVDLDSTTIRGVEALLRWQHPQRGVIPPNDFVPLLEDSGLIVDVGRWVLDTACAQAGRWHALGYDPAMSVNVSMRQLESDSFVEDVRRALAANDLDPRSLVVEVTETALMRDAGTTVSRLQRLKELGVQIAIDDFGTGYSSLAYLRQFPVDVLKIDRSFIASMDGTADSFALIRTMVQLGRALGLVTLAEGIEEEHQLESLRSHQCHSGQGFMFSKPVEPELIEMLLVHAARATQDQTTDTCLVPTATSH
jgi:diguanylate cyclase (GGDEF)-like protein/PAS domain S-box-containing protein